MSRAPGRRRRTDEGLELPRWVQWVFGLFVLVPLVFFVVLNLWIGEQQVDPEDYPEITALEDTLRPRGAVEDAVARYEAVMQKVADELSARQPGLTWQWDRQVSSSKCSGDFEDTAAVQLRTRRLVANRPILNGDWASAHQVVRDHASGTGVSYVSGYELPNGIGGEIDLTQADVAVLSGVTPCQLKRDDLGDSAIG